MNNGDLGRFGESEFRSWCNAAGYVINSSSEYDATGWDFKIEPKHLLVDDTMLGLNPENAYSHSVIDFQIKTTEKDTSKWSIRLDHLIRFAHSPHPAFLCIIQVDTQENRTKKIYLIHINERHINNILKKQRQLAKKGKNTQNKTLTIKGESSDIISSNFANEIKDKIEEVLKKGAQSYTQTKMKSLKTVGYDTSSGNIKFSAGLDEMVNTSLGLNDGFPVNDFSIEDLRFNIPLQKEIGPGRLTILPEEKDATILLTCPNTDSLVFSVKARMSPFFEMHHGNLASMSFLHESFLIALFKGKITLSPKNPELISLKNLKIFSSLRSSLRIGCEFKIHLNGELMSIPIDFKGLRGEDESYTDWIHLLSFCNFAITQDFGSVEADLNQLMNQLELLIFTQNLIDKNDKYQIKAVFDSSTSDTIDSNIVMSLKIPYVVIIKLGVVAVALVFHLGRLELLTDDKKIKLIGTAKNAEYFGCFTFSLSNISQFNELYSEKAMKLLPVEDTNTQYVMNEGHVFSFLSSNVWQVEEDIIPT